MTNPIILLAVGKHHQELTAHVSTWPCVTYNNPPYIMAGGTVFLLSSPTSNHPVFILIFFYFFYLTVAVSETPVWHSQQIKHSGHIDT